MITKQIRIYSDRKFINLFNLIVERFKEKHGIDLESKEVCETIAKAIEDNDIVF